MHIIVHNNRRIQNTAQNSSKFIFLLIPQAIIITQMLSMRGDGKRLYMTKFRCIWQQMGVSPKFSVPVVPKPLTGYENVRMCKMRRNFCIAYLYLHLCFPFCILQHFTAFVHVAFLRICMQFSYVLLNIYLLTTW